MLSTILSAWVGGSSSSVPPCALLGASSSSIGLKSVIGSCFRSDGDVVCAQVLFHALEPSVDIAYLLANVAGACGSTSLLWCTAVRCPVEVVERWSFHHEPDSRLWSAATTQRMNATHVRELGHDLRVECSALLQTVEETSSAAFPHPAFGCSPGFLLHERPHVARMHVRHWWLTMIDRLRIAQGLERVRLLDIESDNRVTGIVIVDHEFWFTSH